MDWEEALRQIKEHTAVMRQRLESIPIRNQPNDAETAVVRALEDLAEVDRLVPLLEQSIESAIEEEAEEAIAARSRNDE